MRFFQEDSIRNSASDTLKVASPELSLQPLFEPEAVTFSFEAPGWTYLFALVFVVLLVTAFFAFRAYQRNAYRREALSHLDSLDKAKDLDQVFVTLKSVAMYKYGRSHVGNLMGKEWLVFLEKKVEGIRWSPLETEIESFLYQNQSPSPEIQNQLFTQAKDWIRKHA